MILIHSWPVRIASGLILTGVVLVASASVGTASRAAPNPVEHVPQMLQASTAVPVTTSPDAPTLTAVTTGTPGNVIVAAIVNGKTLITVAQLDAEVNRQLDARASLNDPAPADLNSFRDSVLNSLIQQALIEQAAVIQGVVVTDQDVDTEIQSYIQAAGGRDKWLIQVSADHMTEAEYRVGLRSALITLKMRDLVTANIGTTAEQVHARHILVADLNTANQILQQLQAGADFSALANKYSLDLTTKQTGGDLGWFTRGQLLQKTVEDAAFSQAVNQFTAPIKSELGYHIIQVLEKVSNRPLDPATRSRLAEQTFETWLQSLVKAANIVKYPKS